VGAIGNAECDGASVEGSGTRVLVLGTSAAGADAERNADRPGVDADREGAVAVAGRVAEREGAVAGRDVEHDADRVGVGAEHEGAVAVADGWLSARAPTPGATPTG
jgi:hypothetical protein